MPKLITYKKVKVVKPDTMSITALKRLIDALGKDYCFTIQNVVDFLNK